MPSRMGKPKNARIDVKTLADAQKVAERRKKNLEERKLDKCPVCDQKHWYEKTWSTVSPPVKTQMLSTHLTTCPRFLALSGEEKMAAIIGNAACSQCASWDHSNHKPPGGKPARELKCSVKIDGTNCGAAHGRWYHEGTGGGGAHSVVAASSRQAPGLYEVYLAPVHPPGGDQDVDPSPGMIMIDPGSDTNFVKHEFAKKLGLQGEPCQFRLKVVDREARPIKTARYLVEIEDKDGGRHSVYAMGLETITVLPPDPDLSPLHGLLAGYPRQSHGDLKAM